MPRTTPDIPTEGLFPGVNGAAVRQFLERLATLDAPAGSVIFEERDAGDSLFIVLTGQVSLRCDTAAGEVVELARVGPADIFGELVVLSPASRSATATALTPVHALVLGRPLFNALLLEREPAAEALLKSIARRTCARLRQTDARISVLHDALRGASPLDLLSRIERVVADADPQDVDEIWAARLAAYLNRPLL
jgi:CRP-like cAMP-binding protein